MQRVRSSLLQLASRKRSRAALGMDRGVDRGVDRDSSPSTSTAARSQDRAYRRTTSAQEGGATSKPYKPARCAQRILACTLYHWTSEAHLRLSVWCLHNSMQPCQSKLHAANLSSSAIFWLVSLLMLSACTWNAVFLWSAKYVPTFQKTLLAFLAHIHNLSKCRYHHSHFRSMFTCQSYVRLIVVHLLLQRHCYASDEGQHP